MSVKKNRVYRKTRYVLYKETLVDFKEHVWAFIGSFVGLGIITYLHFEVLPQHDLTLLIGSFGASCVLIYGAIGSPLAQPKNLILGHVISAFIGVTIFKLFGDYIWIAAPLAVSLAIIGMQMSKALHPPGGATALIAVTGGKSVTSLGYMYVFSPILTGVTILFIVALIFNNIPHKRQYPVRSYKHLYRLTRRNKK